eukprot:CFRG5834T1
MNMFQCQWQGCWRTFSTPSDLHNHVHDIHVAVGSEDGLSLSQDSACLDREREPNSRATLNQDVPRLSSITKDHYSSPRSVLLCSPSRTYRHEKERFLRGVVTQPSHSGPLSPQLHPPQLTCSSSHTDNADILEKRTNNRERCGEPKDYTEHFGYLENSNPEILRSPVRGCKRKQPHDVADSVDYEEDSMNECSTPIQDGYRNHTEASSHHTQGLSALRSLADLADRSDHRSPRIMMSPRVSVSSPAPLHLNKSPRPRPLSSPSKSPNVISLCPSVDYKQRRYSKINTFNEHSQRRHCSQSLRGACTQHRHTNSNSTPWKTRTIGSTFESESLRNEYSKGGGYTVGLDVPAANCRMHGTDISDSSMSSPSNSCQISACLDSPIAPSRMQLKNLLEQEKASVIDVEKVVPILGKRKGRSSSTLKKCRRFGRTSAPSFIDTTYSLDQRLRPWVQECGLNIPSGLYEFCSGLSVNLSLPLLQQHPKLTKNSKTVQRLSLPSGSGARKRKGKCARSSKVVIGPPPSIIQAVTNHTVRKSA